MIQYTFSVSCIKASVETLQFSEVCDKVSVIDIDPQLVSIICDGVWL